MFEYLESAKSYPELVSKLIVEELYRLGVNKYAVAPGARLIPMLSAIKGHEKTEMQLFNDERSAAFWAQGFAKVNREPIVLLVTSGTACANLLPGVIEAYKSNIPLIVITCDRPWELKDSGANQTIKQSDIFADFSKFTLDLPAITEDINTQSILANIDHLHAIAKAAPAGPVHLNIAFRKPFSDDAFKIDQINEDELALIKDWFFAKVVFKHHTRHQVVPVPEEIKALELAILEADKPVLVIGSMLPSAENQQIVKLAEKIGAPIFADLNSGLRGIKSNNLVSYYSTFVDKLDYKSDLVLYFGNRIVSETLKKYLQKQKCKQLLFTDNQSRQDAVENDFLPFTKHVFCNPALIAKSLTYLLLQKESDLSSVSKSNQEARQSLLDAIRYNDTESINELNVIVDFGRLIPAGSLVYHSSSLIFRELETVLAELPENTFCLSNRGAVGIDGVIASSVGAAVASCRNSYLLIGDQAFLHDVSSLSLLKNSNLKVIVFNNAGGAVFDILETDEISEDLKNQQDINITDLAKSLGLAAKTVKTRAEFKESLADINTRIIEVIFPEDLNSAELYLSLFT